MGNSCPGCSFCSLVCSGFHQYTFVYFSTALGHHALMHVSCALERYRARNSSVLTKFLCLFYAKLWPTSHLAFPESTSHSVITNTNFGVGRRREHRVPALSKPSTETLTCFQPLNPRQWGSGDKRTLPIPSTRVSRSYLLQVPGRKCIFPAGTTTGTSLRTLRIVDPTSSPCIP